MGMRSSDDFPAKVERHDLPLIGEGGEELPSSPPLLGGGGETSPTGFFYEEPFPLLSVGISSQHIPSPVRETVSIQLEGNVTSRRGLGHTLNIPYSVGVTHEVRTQIQRWEWGVERWEVVTYPLNYELWWISGFFLRFAWAHDGKLFLILLPHKQIGNFLCRLVILDVSGPVAAEVTVQDLLLGYDFLPTTDSFGSVEVGHSFIAFCRHGDCVLINPTNLETEKYRAIYLSSQYKEMVKGKSTPYIFPLAVSEGILLLPVGLFFSLETYYQLRSINLSHTSHYRVVRCGEQVLVTVPSDIHEREGLINSAFRWNGVNDGFVSIAVDNEEPPYAPFGIGAYHPDNIYVAYGANADDLDERLLYMYKLEEGALVVRPLPFSSLPLSSFALLYRYLPPYATQRWLESFFQVVSNGNWLYTTRLWNRIYRFNLEGDWELAAIVPIWVEGSYEYLEPEMPCQTHLCYDRVRGQVYAVLRYGDADHLTIYRQEEVISPPPTPTISSVDWATRTVVITPPVSEHSQEFAVFFYNPTGQVIYELCSWKERRLWYVSTDGGNNWSPMEKSIRRISEGDNVLVKVIFPFDILPDEDYRVVAYSFQNSAP